jgi:hypothetical protein
MSDALSSGFHHAAHRDREWYIPNGIQTYLETGVQRRHRRRVISWLGEKKRAAN